MFLISRPIKSVWMLLPWNFTWQTLSLWYQRCFS